MPLHIHVHDFYREWLNKADDYQEDSLSGYFNKAFSLFTLYNKLYAEATFSLARNNIIRLDEDRSFPDRKGATEYAPRYLEYENLLAEFTNDNECSEAIINIINHIDNGDYNIKLSMPYGRPQPEKDKELVQRIKSTDAKTKVEAILDLVYSVRCNMFHGNKQFDQIQMSLLKSVTTIQRKVIQLLYNKLSNET